MPDPVIYELKNGDYTLWRTGDGYNDWALLFMSKDKLWLREGF